MSSILNINDKLANNKLANNKLANNKLANNALSDVRVSMMGLETAEEIKEIGSARTSGKSSTRSPNLASPESEQSDSDRSEDQTQIIAKSFKHYSPLLNFRDQYFEPDRMNASIYDGVLSVIVCAYNENYMEIVVTLRDLKAQHEVMKENGINLDMHVCVILDGWSKVCQTTKQYLKKVFPVETDTFVSPRTNTCELYLNRKIESNHAQSDNYNVQNWQLLVDSWDRQDSNNNVVPTETLIIQNVRPDTNELAETIIDPIDKLLMKVTFIVKRDNRRKHNSHEWFLQSFASKYSIPILLSRKSATQKTVENSLQLVFMTDAGTRFNSSCLSLLVQHIVFKPQCVAVTGRQRVMSFPLQYEAENTPFNGNLPPCPGEGWFESFLRCAQAFEYDIGVISYIPFFSAFGKLPVVPGPCGLFRLDLLIDQNAQLHAERRAIEAINLATKRIQTEQGIQNQTIDSLFSKFKTYRQEKTIQTSTRKQLLQLIQTEDNYYKSMSSTRPPVIHDDCIDANEEFFLSLAWLYSNHKHLIAQQDLLIEYLKYDAMNNRAGKLSDPFKVEIAKLAFEDINPPCNEIKTICKILETLLDVWNNPQHQSQYPTETKILDIHNQISKQTKSLSELLEQQYANYKYLNSKVAERLFGSEHTTHPANRIILVRVDPNNGFSKDSKETDRAQMISDLKHARDPLEFYFRCVNAKSTETGLLFGSLLLAEDRILSDAAVLKCDHVQFPVISSVIADAVYYVQAETDSEQFVQQRRRWTNGGMAAYMVLIMLQWSGVYERANKRFSICNNWSYITSSSMIRYFVFMIQLFQMVLAALGPALLTLSLRISLHLFNFSYDNSYDYVLIVCYFLYFTGFMWAHCKPRSSRLSWPFWYLGILLNSVVLALTYTTLGIFVKNQVQKAFATGDYFSTESIVSAIVILFVSLPFILTFLIDLYTFMPSILWSTNGLGKFHFIASPSTLYQHSSFIRICLLCTYFIFVPSISVLLHLYSYCRTWELTWGNRPSDSSAGNNHANNADKRMINRSHLIAGAIWALNLCFLIPCLEFDQEPYLLLLLSVAVLAWPLIQMIISLCWLLQRILLAPFLGCCRCTWRIFCQCLPSCCYIKKDSQ